MMYVVESQSTEVDFLNSVSVLITGVFNSVEQEIERNSIHRGAVDAIGGQFSLGKMLRSRLGMTLCRQGVCVRSDIVKACAATELIHSATLFHDDVIDGASLRRGQPSLWASVGETGAILIGDLFLSEALQLIIESGDIHRVSSFVAKVREVCAKEMVHELVYRGTKIDIYSCVNVARGKTGPLFAFVAEVCGGKDAELTDVLMEVGYLLGTAYQIADDLIDVNGNEALIGKTLGTDIKRRKFTLAHSRELPESFSTGKISSLCCSALDLLLPWPEYLSPVAEYIVSYLLPSMDIELGNHAKEAAYEVG